MSVSRAYTLYAANINGAMIDQVTSFGVSSGLEQFILMADGGVDPTFSAVKTLVPKLTLSTTGIASGLAVAGMNAANITSGATFFFQRLKDGGTRATGSDHMKMSVSKGMVFIRSLEAQHDEPAELSYEVLCLTDGGGAPVTITSNQALSGTPAVDQLFVAGPVSLNGTKVGGVKSTKIDFGIKETVIGADGEVYPSFAGIMTREPKITIETYELDIMATLGIEGSPQDGTPSKIYLRAVEPGGTRIAESEEQHVAIGFTAGHIGIGETDAKPGDPATMTIEITPIFDGTNDILTIDSTAAIS